MQFEPVDITDMVNLVTGDFVYSLPLLTVPGPNGGYPLAMSYHSGIRLNQEATWVGLGWTLNVGAINRVVSGYPDDFTGASVLTSYEAEGESDDQYSVGISYGVGAGSVGLSFSFDSNMGFGGVNAILGIQHGFYRANASIGTSSSVSSGIGVGPISASSYASGSGAGFSYSAILGAGGVGAGYSLGSTGSSGGFVSTGGGLFGMSRGPSSQGNSSITGRSSSLYIPIPLPNLQTLNILLSKSKYEWEFDETSYESA
ncbi:MAG: DUF6531 domain-containing protein, partial [Bacteroidota bacterium]